MIDRDAFAARFPTVHLDTTPFHVAYEVGADSMPVSLTREQADAFARAEAVVTFSLPPDLPVVAPRLRWVQGIGSGMEHVIRPGANELVYTNAAGCSAPSIAEWVITQIFAISTRLPHHFDQQRRHEWKMSPGRRVAGRRATIVGMGAIGQEVAWRLHALGVEVTGVRRSDAPLPAGVTAMVTPDRMLPAVATADVVVACVPGGDATEDLFDAEFFAAVPAGSIFVNVGRGSSVDESALIAALARGHLYGAAIDVAKHEPLPADDPLWDTPGLIITSHSAASMEGYMAAVRDLFYDNLERVLAGRALRNVVATV